MTLAYEATNAPAGATDLLSAVLELRDPVGVLSVYAGADPTLTGGARPAWQAPVRDGLRRVVDAARSDWQRESRYALERRVDELAPELEALLDPRGTGRGRALFAAISAPEHIRLELRTPLEPLVEVGRRARALPLVAALAEERPAGVALVRGGGIEVLEWTPAGLRPVAAIELAEPDPEGRGRPGRTNPAVPQSSPERDRFARANDARLATALTRSAEQVRRLAGAHGWDVLVVDGDARLADELEPSPAGEVGELVRSPVPLATVAEAEAAARVEVVVREARAREQARLARLAETGPLVTRGARAVSIALDHGRVDRLLLDPSVAPAAGERLLQKALATSAAVTVAPTRAGAAALLRW